MWPHGIWISSPAKTWKIKTTLHHKPLRAYEEIT
jgi:hypothetical protein